MLFEPLKKVFVVDAMNLAFRCYHAFAKKPLTTKSGQPTSAVFGSAVILIGLIEKEKPDYLLIVSDSRGKNFRHDLYAEYKSNRGETPEDFLAQLPLLEKLFDYLGAPVIKKVGFEADDLIGTLTHRFASNVTNFYIVSGDKDFCQLVNEHVFLYAPQKAGEFKIVDRHGVNEKFGCFPDKVIEVLGLMGDASDAVPGVKGVGEKTAAKLIEEYGSLENLLVHAHEVKNKKVSLALIENEKMARLSKVLVTIKTDCDLEDFALENFRYNPEKFPDPRLLALFSELEFTSLTKKFTGINPVGPVHVHKNSLDYDFSCVTTLAQLVQLEKILSEAEYFAFDTETTGLDSVSDRPIGISFAVPSGQSFYVPYKLHDLPGISPHLTDLDPTQEVAPFLRRVFEQSQKMKIAHNLKFDLQMLHNIDVRPVGPFVDTMLGAFVLNPADQYSMDYLCAKFLQAHKIPTSALMGAKKDKPMWSVGLDLVSQYACEDAYVTLRLYEHELEPIKEQGLEDLWLNQEVKLAPILAEMEQLGIKIDTEKLLDISNELAIFQNTLTQEIVELAGEDFNIQSPKQLQVILFDKLKVHEQVKGFRLKKTKTGFSTDVSVLEDLEDVPIAAKLLDYRMVAKLKSTYVDTLPMQISPKTHRIHTSYQQTGTATGRLSSVNPNLQNIPIRSDWGKRIRSAFIAEDGWKLISADYSQIELRVLAHLSNDQVLIDAFNAGVDIHISTAAAVFECAINEVTHQQRGQAKAINYGILYGMGAHRLAKATSLDYKGAKLFIEKYFVTFKRVKSFIDEQIEWASTNGYCKTITGRRRYIENLHSKDSFLASAARNIAVNTPIQGSAADLMKKAMIDIDVTLKEKKLKTRLLLQVHDELIFEAPLSEVEQVSAVIKNGMEHAMELNVPLEVSLGVGHSWLEAHE